MRIFKALDGGGLRFFLLWLLDLLQGFVKSSEKKDSDLVTADALNDLESRKADKTDIGNARLIVKDRNGKVISNDFTANKKDGDVTISIVRPTDFGSIFNEEYEKKTGISIDGLFSFAGGDEDADEESTAESANPKAEKNGTATLKFYNTKNNIKGDIYDLCFYADNTIFPTGSNLSYKQINFDFHMNMSGNLITLLGVAKHGYWLYMRGANPNNKINSIDIKGNYGVNRVMIVAPEYDAKGDVNGEAYIRAYICVASSVDTAALKTAMMSSADLYFVLRNSK